MTTTASPLELWEVETMNETLANYCLLPGAGSAGLTWTSVQDELDGALFPIPDGPDVGTMAEALLPELLAVERPRILVGASLGAMVALDIAHRIDVDALVLIASGFGIVVSQSLLDWVASDPPELFEKMSRMSVATPDDEEVVALIQRDFALRGQAVVLRHLQALANYAPVALATPPPTLVVWGEMDRSVPFDDHLELAEKCHGALVPVAGAKHMAFFENPIETARWCRAAFLMSTSTNAS